MLKRVQHDKKKYVIPNLFRNLEFGNDNKLIASVLVQALNLPTPVFVKTAPEKARPVDGDEGCVLPKAENSKPDAETSSA